MNVIFVMDAPTNGEIGYGIDTDGNHHYPMGIGFLLGLEARQSILSQGL
jgi:hypothetical protein